LTLEGGNYKLDKEWYRCKKCYKLIDGIENHFRCGNCSRFGESELVNLNKPFRNTKTIKPIN